MKRHILICLIVGFIAIMGCTDKHRDSKASLPTAGILTIGVDESLRPFVDDEIRTFLFYYKQADIIPLYMPEKKVIAKLISNQIQTAIICRDLYDDEVNLIKINYNHSTIRCKLAEDKIVAVVNNANPINEISRDDIRDILSGKITDWRQLDPNFNEKSTIVLVLTDSSSIDRYFTSINKQPFPITSYGLATTTEVIEYVKNNPYALGVLGGSWFYQKGEKYKNVKLLSFKKDISRNDNPEQGLTREVFAVTHEPFTGLGIGFISFMGEQKGQLIILKAGMIPYKPIERNVKITRSFKD
jgi:phosphate transport system substrate-binding protein